MGRDFKRSDKTNVLFEIMAVKHRLSITVEIPGSGKVRVRGDALREFLWVLRSNQSDELIDKWVEEQKGRFRDLELEPVKSRASDDRSEGWV